MISPAKYRRIKVAPVLISINTQSCSQVSSQMFLHSIVAQTLLDMTEYAPTESAVLSFSLLRHLDSSLSAVNTHIHTVHLHKYSECYTFFFFFTDSLSISLFLHSMVIFFLFSSWHLSSVITKGKSPLETLVSVWPLIHIAWNEHAALFTEGKKNKKTKNCHAFSRACLIQPTDGSSNN